MKKVLLFITMAAALLFTQCKKEVSVPSVGKTVSMTVTAGPGSKTDITENGAITWSTGDKLYVGDGSKYIGYLTLVGEGGSATGVFTGNVTLPTSVKDGDKPMFGFFYLGSAELTLEDGATSVDVDFSSQDITKRTDGKLTNASKQHVGYGSATGTVINDVVTDINVMLVSKVALAHFSFTKNAVAYTGALTLSGDNICNKMTVNFASVGFDCTGTVGEINLTNTTSSEKYVMLVPTDETTGSQTLTFAGAGFEGSATFGSGIEANKFYGRESAIEVKHIEFSVSGSTKVKFAPGNLYYDGSAFHFEANQWDFRNYSGLNNDAAFINNGEIRLTPSGTIGSFYWSKDAAKAYAEVCYDPGAANTDVFFTNATETTANTNFHVNGETGENKWRTLSKDEWVYLMNTDGESGRTDANRFAKAKVSNVHGLLIFPDGYSGTTTGEGIATVNTTNAGYPSNNIPDNTWTSMESDGVVFLPAAGERDANGSVWNVGSQGRYWSSTCLDINNAYYMFFNEGSVYKDQSGRNHGFSVRLVR